MATPKKKAPRKKKVAKSKMSNNVQKEQTGITAPDIVKDLPENDVYFTREFELYAIWKALPPMLKGETPADLEKKYFVDDEQIIQLLQLKTQRQFADHFNLNEHTPSRWNERLKDRDLFADIRQWTNKLLKNVMMSTYRAAMLKDPKANSDRKLFMQFSGWGEEINVNNKGESLTELFKRGLNIK